VRLSGGIPAFEAVIKKIRIPLLTSRLGLDIITSDHPLYSGRPGTYGERSANFAVQNSDLIIAVGSRLTVSLTGYNVKDFGRNAEKIIVDLNIKHKKDPSIFEEGSYKAGLEEFVEASIFNQYLQKKTIGKLSKIKVDSDIFVAGLCDVPGELLRYAIKSATEKKFDEVKRCRQAADEIIGELVDMNLTGYNRQKFDQAKQALHKLEQVLYEVSIRS